MMGGSGGRGGNGGSGRIFIGSQNGVAGVPNAQPLPPVLVVGAPGVVTSLLR
jgi:hypothetical protein